MDDWITLAGKIFEAIAILDRHVPTRIFDQSRFMQHSRRSADADSRKAAGLMLVYPCSGEQIKRSGLRE
jgi:hypothetical protein